MQTQVINATEYRDVPLSLLNESKTNPRRTFEPNALKELAESIKTQGVLSPLLVERISPRSTTAMITSAWSSGAGTSCAATMST